MRKLKNVIVLAVIACCAILIPENITVLYALAGLIAIMLTFNLLVRRSPYFKPYFLSKINIFSAKSSKKFEVDIPTDLAFDKIKEVIAQSRFKLITEDRNKLEILTISKISWRSWGETIYFTLEETVGKTLVKFDSAALFQIYSWGKNEDNYKVFFEKLEDSFTI